MTAAARTAALDNDIQTCSVPSVSRDTNAKTPKTRSVYVRITDAEREWLEAEAARQERTISGLLRLALRDYVKKVAA